MDEQQSTLRPLVFDRFVLDPELRTLRRDGEEVALQAKAFELLAMLVARRGVPVSREELYGRLWPDGVVEDGNLTQNVYLLRRILDPAGTGRTFIETLPRYGYRFSKPVQDARRPAPFVRSVWRRFAFGGALIAIAVVASTAGSAVQPSDVPLSPAASVSYALGQYHLNLRTIADLRHSIVYFSQTVHEAPQSALGFAGVASAYALEAEFDAANSPAFSRDVALAKENRDQALTRGKTSAQAHAVAAFLAFRFDGDPVLAEHEFELAFACDPEDAAAHQWHAVLLFSQGAIRPAMVELELAHQLDPTSEVISRWLGRAYVYRRRPADAIRTLSDTISIEPADAPAWLSLASAQEESGKLRDALQTLETVGRRLPDERPYVIPDEARVRLLLSHGSSDPRTIMQMNSLVADKRVDAVEAALYYVALGSRDRAITVLRASRPASPIAAVLEKADPRFESIQSDPRFQQLFD
ncbi:MAG TPA: winged helix-turn-helix domain-containing protein [Candidatus Eremiobacteraceae bacterium]